MLGKCSLACLVVMTIALSGCAVFRVEPTALQSATIGDVIIHVDVCAFAVGSCPATGATEADTSANQYDLQMLLGFLIPDGVDAPASFDTSSGPTAAFARNDSYSAALGQLTAAPPGSHWVGYATTTTYHWQGNANPAKEFTADPQFRLPQASDGSPFHGPFSYRSVVGIRAISAGHPVTAPVDCDGAPLSTQTFCSEHVAGSPAYGTDFALATRDLGVVGAGVPATANPGGTVSVPFNLRYAGAATPAAAFALSAVSDLPGATPMLSRESVTPASDSDNSLLATVGVPAGAAPGNYSVTVTAALPNGQTRRGTSTLTVVPVAAPPPAGTVKDTTPPQPRLAIRVAKLGALIRSRKLHVTASLDEPGSVRLSAKVPAKPHSKRTKTLHAIVTFDRSGTHSAVLLLTKSSAAALRGRKMVKFRVAAAATDLAGNTNTAAASRAFRR